MWDIYNVAFKRFINKIHSNISPRVKIWKRETLLRNLNGNKNPAKAVPERLIYSTEIKTQKTIEKAIKNQKKILKESP